MTTEPMQPPGRQPIGFWTVRAGEAIGARTRAALEAIGVTQPEWWVLQQLCSHPDGMPRADLTRTIGPNNTVAAVDTAVAAAIRKGWVREDGANLGATEAGAEQFERAAQVQQVLQDERMRGIGEDEYVTTITVLQRTIANVGGAAWHW
ncbi:MAG: hypothetical protein HOQ44_06785 [Nocardia sp.]|nr:hypothetical protein [Nocardia sp.]